MVQQKTILVVDDNQELREALSEYLGKANFLVDTASDGEVMWQKLANKQPDLIVLDIMLPGDDGFTLCSQIRRRSNVPIIMLTAVTDEVDRVAGLEVGADDYITKSFSPRELLARIKALLRRCQFQSGQGPSREINFDGWHLDTITRQLSFANEQPQQLTSADYSLLYLFLSKPNQLLSRDDIARTIWGRDAAPLERGIDVQISRLRKHLHDDKRCKILTVRHKGYMAAFESVHES